MNSPEQTSIKNESDSSGCESNSSSSENKLNNSGELAKGQIPTNEWLKEMLDTLDPQQRHELAEITQKRFNAWLREKLRRENLDIWTQSIRRRCFTFPPPCHLEFALPNLSVFTAGAVQSYFDRIYDPVLKERLAKSESFARRPSQAIPGSVQIRKFQSLSDLDNASAYGGSLDDDEEDLELSALGADYSDDDVFADINQSQL